jgi:hypothetical protein
MAGIMKWVNSADIENYANSRDCQENLSLLIRRLIRATVRGITSISFPSGKGIVYPGWDGKLESREETEYIPIGLSVWELSTQKDAKKKAEEDYRKRKENPLGINPKEATFIFVTPRIWSEKDDWVNKKRKEGFWKDVKVYDARDLEEWIEQAPAVGVWLARHLGKYPENILSLGDWWYEWSQITRPPLIPDLLLGGRKNEAEEVVKWLKLSPSYLAIQSYSKDEVIGFLASVILNLTESEREYFLSRAIVVKDENSFRHITTTCKNSLLLICTFEDVEFLLPYSSRHHIFIPLNPDNTISKDKIILPHISREDFVSNLNKMGISTEEAERLSKDTSRMITVLRRQLTPVSNQPGWAKYDKAKALLPVLLVGKWDEKKEGDKEIVSQIAKIPYDEYVNSLTEYLSIPDPPIIKVGSVWRLISHIDAFLALAPFLTNTHFENFKSVSFQVLKELNPSLELEPEKRWMASVYGKTPKYSNELREGIVQTLILIAVYGDKINGGKGLDLPSTAQTWVDNFVRDLLKDTDWKLWLSLADILPFIAEASPTSFLDAVENSLSQNPSSIMEMFFETEDILTSPSYHPSLLWALECLAWSPELLSRVALILAKLSKLDPGVKLENRPINSLRSIFLLWLPQTFATLKQRLEVLDLLLDRETEIAWRLIINLFPRSHDIGSYNYKPRWRQFSNVLEEKVTIIEHLEGITGIVDRALKKAGYEGKRWCDIMENFDNLPSQERKKVLSKLSEIINLITKGKFGLWNKLRRILSRHRSFPGASWALPEEELKEIEKLYNTLVPDNIIQLYKWLFDDYYPEIPEGKSFDDYKKLEEIISQKRKEALKSINDRLGINGIIELSVHTKNPQFVGITLAEFSLTNEEERILFSLLDSNEQNKILFVQSYIWQKSFKNKDVFIDKVVNDAVSENWSSEKIVNLFLALQQNRKVWDLLKNFDVQIQQKYWEKIDPRFFDLSKEDKLYALNKLMDVKRYFTSLDVASLLKNELPPEFIAELLRKAATQESVDDFIKIHPLNIEDLFKVLDQSKEITKDTIAELEWLYLHILAEVDSSRPPRVLHQKLSEEPEFFAEVISYLYKPQNMTKEEEKLPDELEQQRAELAWKLLNTWKIVPGSESNGKIKYDKLNEWVNKARQLCREMDRLDVCDNHIGQVLAYALPDVNGNWPPEEVCKIIDEVGSKELDDGFLTEVYNKRGIFSKSLFEGGEHELELADRYERYSEIWANKYPRTSSILKKISDVYKNEAKIEDEEVKRRKLEW